MESKQFLKEYLNGMSAVSFEAMEGQKIWADYIRPFVDKVYDENYGTVVGVINPDAEFKVVIDAHSDEISWYVSHIDATGHIFVKRNGGSDPHIAPSKDVKIYTRSGKIVDGMFGWVAVHMRPAKSTLKPELDKIWVDVGATTADEVAEMGVAIGDVMIFTDQFRVLNGNKYVGKSLDDKIGGYINAEVVRRLFENKDNLPFGLYIVNSVQEEIGLRGAQMTAQAIKPNVAICFDPTHDTSIPHVDKKTYGDFKMGDGVVFSVSPSIHRNLTNLMMDVATKNDIGFKLDVRPRGSGTNCDAYTYSSGNGCVTTLVSIPLKYMHTTVEMVLEDDVNDAIDLIYNTLKTIENNQDFRYLKLD